MMCNLIVDGIGYSFGVFLSEFVDAFKEPKSKVSLVGSLLCGTYLFAGPVVSAMTNKYGCRPVVIAGSCIATVAFILATFSPNIEIMMLTYGVLGGFGLGMVYLPSIVSVGYYFEKKRAFATGLAVCGSGLGTFIFPPLSEILLLEFSWKGGLLIIAGIIFHASIFGALMRPLTAAPSARTKKKPRAKTFVDRLKETHNRDRSVSESSNANHSVGDSNKIQERVMLAKLQREKHLQDTDSDTGSLPSIAFIKKGHTGHGDNRRFSGGIPVAGESYGGRLSVSSTGNSGNSPAKEIPNSPKFTSVIPTTPQAEVKGDRRDHNDGSISPDSDSDARLPGTVNLNVTNDGTSTDDYFTPPVSPANTVQNTPRKDHDAGSDQETPENCDHKLTNGITQNTVSELVPLIEVPAPVIRPGGYRAGSYGGSRTNVMNLQSMTSLHVSKKDLARPLYRKDIFYSGSVLNIPQFRSQPDMKSYITSITTIPGEMEFVEGPSPSSKFINTVCSCLPRPARDILSEMADVSLFKDISFMLICLGNVAAFLGFYIPFMFLVDRSVSLGVDKTQATFLISIIGITNTVGRVAIGKLADLHIIDSLVITYISIALCGLVTGLVPFCNTYPLLATNAAVFGLGMAAYISLSSIIICDRMGLEKLTNAFGLLSMVRGIAGMLGPPLAGFMYDSSGSYDLSFFMGGLLLFIGAACHVLLHLPSLRSRRLDKVAVEEVARDEVLQIIGSKPQIVTIEEALSSG
ncbi:unnamed protein product [Candidula unifasciata]|uniref:Major facilitator superfamily (MFS) profile domain-containing protein n=1 Tax=Candidula unifasciata TaxID=100452 RepID=A0A8S4A7K9_9EUPU|nr:unnamed protein product [Candidula unifasciata]